MRKLSIALLTCLAAVCGANGMTPEETEFFEKRIRPVLAEQCYKCHGPEKQKGELRLDSREAMLKGSDVGVVLVPGKPEESSLIQSIRHEGESKMPEKADKLPEEEISALSEWVRMGAPWPVADAPQLSLQQQAGKRHWSFQPVRRTTPPEVRDSKRWAQSEIDRFILAPLEAAGLEPSPLAARPAIIRRATFDLTGLPPTREESEAFEKDEAPDAYAKVVDRLLASPRYGERWGRYWLDVARYADTKGYVFQEERRYPYAYTYRDWVIRSLNDDLPYDQFLIQQIAADHIVKADDPRPMAAMGFLTLGRRFLNAQPDIIDDRIDVVSRGTMGITVSCARCHDHKFDPITQKDYYALYGVFASSMEPAELPLLGENPDPQACAEYAAELAKREAARDEFLAGKSVEIALALSVGLQMPVVLPPAPRDAIKHLLGKPDRDRSRELQNKVEELNAGELSPPRAMALTDAPTLVQPRVFKRGNPGMPGDEVPRRFIAVLSGDDPKPFTQGSGRLELAQAIASKENPLTARVMVNRIWANHFGKGLVRTPGDFGVKGDEPTHPELLDFLAHRFMDGGWSLKGLHRLIMLSSTYQQSSAIRPELAERDPENRLLWRYNRRRLDFEAMRDSLLMAAGQLDLKMGGKAVELTTPPYAQRRAVYGFIDRQNLPGVFRTFDFASPDTTSPQRYVTTVPQQALFMLNSPFVVERARAVAGSLQQEPDGDRVQRLYTRLFARPAEEREVAEGLRFVAGQAAKADGATGLTPWEKYAQVLLATNEFVFVD